MTQPQTNAQLAYSLGAVSAGLSALQNGVQSGEVTMKPDVGPTLINSLDSAIAGARGILRSIANVDTPAHLGSNPVSTSMTTKFSQRADGSGQAVGPLLQQYLNLLQLTKSSVTAAIGNFESVDGQISSDLHAK